MLDAFNKGYRVIDGRIFNPDGKELTGYVNRRGYHLFHHTKSGPKVYTHKLIAYQKFGDKLFEKGIEVRHLDGNSLNNSEYNISIGTHRDNMMDVPKEVRKRKAIKAAKKLRKFTNEEVDEIKKDYSLLKSYKKVMEKWGITSKGTMHHILNNKYVT